MWHCLIRGFRSTIPSLSLFIALADVSSSERILQKRSDPNDDISDSYEFTDADLDELVKRGSLLRFGKRGSLLRFGKRGSLLRFGKRGSLFRFGKRYDEHVEKSYPYTDDDSRLDG
ncbi:hypothetical protein FSP39_017104 [Pinctada imbricata]|uniref:Uncharacterized protein n=1 Tax=Pinctada imbricata TaxID=66713 RepID=A0AA88YQV6_PINIB|nr:hypothetical protein FSP39_017104 [Pinctada imbricata]